MRSGVLYATWVLGNDYRATAAFYGAYPRGYLPRVMALFSDVDPRSRPDGSVPILHCFSGSLPGGRYVRCDSKSPQAVEYPCSAYDLRWMRGPCCEGFDLILADPPYSAADAVHYGMAGIDQRRATAALAQVARVGAHLAWLDTCWPMHRKAEWQTVGLITVVRSTNHWVRLLSIFERVDVG